MGILTGPRIREEIEAGNINITPYNEVQVNPASYDLRLGNKYSVYMGEVLDANRENKVIQKQLDGYGLLLEPEELYLMHTHEVVHTEKYVPILDGKSSIGRLGITIHLTAGFGDPGFNGQYTLEVVVVKPVVVYPMMRFCQIRFHQPDGPIQLYSEGGHYVGERAKGPVPSMSWTQHREDKGRGEGTGGDQ